MRFVLVIILMLLRLMLIMMLLRAIPMAIRVVVLPGSRALGRISISALPVTELVVKKPSCYPVRAIGGGSSETPDALSLQVLALGNACYSFIFRLLFDITPVVRGVLLAVLLEVGFLGC
jgi:hypothetical protein